MLKNNLILTSALSLLILLQSGCLLNYSNDVVLRQDEPLRGLSFESEYAMHVFDQSAYSRSNRRLTRWYPIR